MARRALATALVPFALACGGPEDDALGTSEQANFGSIYRWQNVATLSPRPYANPFIVQNWGWSVDVGGDRVVIGAFSPDVDVFRRQAARGGGFSYVREASLRPQSGAPSGVFGWDVATDGTRLAVGAAGAENGGLGHQGYVDVYVRSGATWSFEQRVLPTGYPTSYPASGQMAFGRAVDIDGDTLVVGADRYTRPAARPSSTAA